MPKAEVDGEKVTTFSGDEGTKSSLVETSGDAEGVAAAFERAWAVVVGIDDYRDSAIADLKGAEQDADAMNRVLRAHGFNVILLKGSQATMSAVGRAIAAELKEKAGPNDRVVVYFSGHGARFGDHRSPGLLLLWDSTQGATQEALSIQLLMGWLNDVRARQVLFIADSCFAGRVDPVSPEGPPPQKLAGSYVENLVRAPTRVTMVAASSTEFAFENYSAQRIRHKRGLFTLALELILEGDPAAPCPGLGDGWLFDSELYACAERYVLMQSGGRQHPLYQRSGDGAFVFRDPGMLAPDPAASAWAALEKRMRSSSSSETRAQLKKYSERYCGGASSCTAPAAEHEISACARARELSCLLSADAVTGVERAVVPAGKYEVSCNPVYESGCEEGKKYLQIPTLLVDRRETTVAEYRECVAKSKCTAQGLDRSKHSTSVTSPRDADRYCNWNKDRLNHPINCLTFEQAAEYCRFRGGRLPTEAEWEIAAGGRPVKPANLADAAFKKSVLAPGYQTEADYSDGFADSAPVQSFTSSSSFGLYDLSGNVAELVDGRYSPSSASDRRRVCRGGAWYELARDIGYRSPFAREDRDPGVGVRCVRD